MLLCFSSMFMKILAWAVVWFANIHPPKACLLKGCSIACPIGREGLLLGSRAKGNEVSSYRYGFEWGLEICLSVSLCPCLSLFTRLFLFVSLCLCFSLCFWDAVRYIRLLVSHPLAWRRYHRLRATALNEHGLKPLKLLVQINLSPIQERFVTATGSQHSVV